MNTSTYYLGMVLIIFGAFCALLVPVIASTYLYYKERRFEFFSFISFKPEDGKSNLENTLIRVCKISEGISKICFFSVLAIVMYRSFI